MAKKQPASVVIEEVEQPEAPDTDVDLQGFLEGFSGDAGGYVFELERKRPNGKFAYVADLDMPVSRGDVQRDHGGGAYRLVVKTADTRRYQGSRQFDVEPALNTAKNPAQTPTETRPQSDDRMFTFMVESMRLNQQAQLAQQAQTTQILIALIGAKPSSDPLELAKFIAARERTPAAEFAEMVNTVQALGGGGAATPAPEGDWPTELIRAIPHIPEIMRAFTPPTATRIPTPMPRKPRTVTNQAAPGPISQPQPPAVGGSPDPTDSAKTAQGDTAPPQTGDSDAPPTRESIRAGLAALFATARGNPRAQPLSYASRLLDAFGAEQITAQLTATPDGALTQWMIAEVPQLADLTEFIGKVEDLLRDELLGPPEGEDDDEDLDDQDGAQAPEATPITEAPAAP